MSSADRGDFATWAARWVDDAPTTAERARRQGLAIGYLEQAGANLRALREHQDAEGVPSIAQVEAEFKHELADAAAEWAARVGHARACREWSLALIERASAVAEAQRIVGEDPV